MEFDWDAGNIEHIAEHDVEPEEVVEVLYNRPVRVSKEETEEGEARIRVVGRTNYDRLLTVVYTERGEKIRIVTAFDSGPRDIRKYEGRRGKNG